MSSCIKGSLLVAGLAIGLVIGLVAAPAWKTSARADQGEAGKGQNCPRHTVVMTDGLHLIVTDNQTDTLYFYAIEDNEKPGADLKLRGKADLKQVGQPILKPTLLRKKKAD